MRPTSTHWPPPAPALNLGANLHYPAPRTNIWPDAAETLSTSDSSQRPTIETAGDGVQIVVPPRVQYSTIAARAVFRSLLLAAAPGVIGAFGVIVFAGANGAETAFANPFGFLLLTAPALFGMVFLGYLWSWWALGETVEAVVEAGRLRVRSTGLLGETLELDCPVEEVSIVRSDRLEEMPLDARFPDERRHEVTIVTDDGYRAFGKGLTRAEATGVVDALKQAVFDSPRSGGA